MRKVLIALSVFALLVAGVGAAAIVTEYHEWSVDTTETHTCRAPKRGTICTVTDRDLYHGTITDQDEVPDPVTVTTTVTQPPTTTTEPPPPPPPPPPTSGYPDASNTGVVNESALRYWPGHEPGANAQPVYIQMPGQLIENYIFRRAVIVMANNVTFRNSRFKFASDYYMLRTEEDFGGTLVEDSEFDGLGGTDINAAVAGPRWTLRRVDIQGVQDGAKLHDSTKVYDSYIHNLYVYGIADPHYDGLQSMGGNNNVIQHNTIDVGVGAGRNAAVLIKTDFGPIDNVLIDNNRLLGGGWTAMIGPGYTGSYPTNLKLTNNRFGPYAYGPITLGPPPGTQIVRCGNVWDETATAVGKTPGDRLDAPC